MITVKVDLTDKILPKVTSKRLGTIAVGVEYSRTPII